ncbi:hypothetical protein [Siminovitchia sp. 179-K 8D1 HS]|uniref:hypothetical protein n=1 Tax=Siminovitchia sp. 179-K 8D1 HS TaxID=3142385 RepID=UPI00399F8FBE
MSLVCAYITEHFIIISGDHRRVHIKDNEVFFDDAHKVFSINDRVIIGYTGDYDISKKLREHLEKRGLNDASPNEVARQCRRWLQRRSKVDTQQRLLIAGLDDKGKPVIIELTHDSGYDPVIVTVEPGRMDWRLVFANTCPEPFIEEELAKIDVLSPEACAELAKTVNERVAAVDSDVSPACDVGVLIVGA